MLIEFQKKYIFLKIGQNRPKIGKNSQKSQNFSQISGNLKTQYFCKIYSRNMFKGDPPPKNLFSKLANLRTFCLFQKLGTQVGFIFFRKNFQNRAFFGFYGQKCADVSTFFDYTLRENRSTYGPEILTQVSYR